MSAAQAAFDRLRPKSAWTDYFPHRGNPWDERKVGHLYRRAAFGATKDELDRGVKLGPDRLAERLISGGEELAEFDAEIRRLEEGVLTSGDPNQLQAVWLYRMAHSPHPLLERMTLFWHDHFATSNAKVDDLVLMQRQNDLLRRHALGFFGTMLLEATFDPAMLIWLDSATNKKGQPNENYAREIFELFSLGEGNYSEADIQEAARALTGWSVKSGAASFSPSQFDDGEKTILGQTGRWGAGDVVRIALAQPSCARFLVRKIFAEFISETVEPSPEVLDALADEFRVRNYDIHWLLGRVFRSWAFFSEGAIGQRVKGPIEFLVGSIKMLEGRVGPGHLVDACESLGQSLYYPPSVKGWDGGNDWLNSTTLLGRQNLAFELTRGKGDAERCDPARLARKHDVAGDEPLIRFFLSLFLQNEDHESRAEMVAYVADERKKLEGQLYSPAGIEGVLARHAAHLVMTLPEFQLA